MEADYHRKPAVDFRYDEETNTASNIDMIDYHREARNARKEPAPSGRPDLNRDRMKNEPEAVYWYRKAAEQGYPAAEYDLGRMPARSPRRSK